MIDLNQSSILNSYLLFVSLILSRLSHHSEAPHKGSTRAATWKQKLEQIWARQWKTKTNTESVNTRSIGM